MTLVAILNRAPGLDDAEVAFIAEACNQQAREIAAAHSALYTPVVFFASAADLPADARILTIKADIDAPGALGFHDDAAGTIFAEVKYTGAETSTTVSHEICEELVDATVSLWAPYDADHEQALETADRVEGDSYLQVATVAGETRQVAVSNYLLPSAFAGPSAVPPFDRMGRLATWNGMTTGGYVILRDVTTGNVGDVFADKVVIAGAPRVVAGPSAGASIAQKLARRGSRLLRRLRG